MFGNKVIEEIENEFGTFTVEELVYEGRRARVLFSSPQHAAQAGIPLDNDPRLLFDYNQRFFELASELEPKNVLILGGGTLTLAIALVNNFPKLKVTTVEVNKDLIDLAAKYFDYKPNPRLRVIIGDAKTFMLQAKPTFDLIIVDIYDNFTIPKYFRSRVFAGQLKKGLMEGGVVATNCISTISRDKASPLNQIVNAYRNEIGRVRVFKPDDRYIEWLPQNLLIIGGIRIDNVLKSLTEVNLD